MALVYRPEASAGYEWAFPVDDDHVERLVTLGDRPIADTWQPIEFRLLRNGIEADMPWLGSHALVLRPRAAEVLGPLVGKDAELLPLRCHDADLSLLHVWNFVDALDESASTIVRFPSSGRIMDLTRAVFDERQLSGVRCFKVPQYARGSLFVTDDIVEAVAKAGLTGVHFAVASEPSYADSGPRMERLASRRVDARAEADDPTLDEHVWLRLLKIVDERGTAALDPIQMAYYATRLFEDETGSGGPTHFLEFGGLEVGSHVAVGYRLLGRPEAAQAFERMWESEPMRAMVADPDVDMTEEVWHLIEPIGEHDDARRAFVRTHPDAFSI